MSAKVDSIIKELKELSLLEASELVKAIEETFDVSAAAPVAAVAAPAAGAVAGDQGEAAEEKTEFTVKVTEVPADKKIAVIKVVKNALNIGLAEAKTKVEAAPFVVLENAKKEDAEKLKTDLSGAGATVTLE
jgi:large subunit ribosomal protein L7/L12